MNAEEFLQELEVPDRTISGRKPGGQMTAYRGSLIELLESYHENKVENLGLFNVSKCECGKSADILLCDECFTDTIDKAEHGI